MRVAASYGDASVLGDGKGGTEEPGPLDEEAQERQVVEHLLSNFSTDNDGRSYTIKVSFTASDPEVAAEIVNAIVDQYLYDQLQAKREATRAANDWLVERLNELSEEVRNAELAVRRYREEHGLIESRARPSASSSWRRSMPAWWRRKSSAFRQKHV